MSIGPVEVLIIVSAILPIVVLVIVVARLLGRSTATDQGRTLLENAGLPPDDEQAVAVAERFLDRSRHCRLVGTLLGLVAGWFSLPGGLAAGAMAGYLLGAVVAASSDPVEARGERRVAALTPRMLSDYVPRRLVLAVRGVAAAALAIVLAGALSARHQPAVIGTSTARWFALAGAAIAVVLVTELAARRVVSRPQLASSAVDVRLDDALRAVSVRAIVGSGLGLASITLSVAAWVTAVATDVQVLRWALPVLALAALVAAPVAWGVVARPHPWRVQRPVAPVPHEAPAR